jgi:hypothetical protein
VTIDRFKWHPRQPQETGRIAAGREALDESLFHHVEIWLVVVMIVVSVIMRQMWRLPLRCVWAGAMVVAR